MLLPGMALRMLFAVSSGFLEGTLGSRRGVVVVKAVMAGAVVRRGMVGRVRAAAPMGGQWVIQLIRQVCAYPGRFLRGATP